MTEAGRALDWRRTDSTLQLLFATRLVSQTGQALFFAWLFVASGSGTEGATKVGGAAIAMMVASILFATNRRHAARFFVTSKGDAMRGAGTLEVLFRRIENQA